MSDSGEFKKIKLHMSDSEKLEKIKQIVADYIQDTDHYADYFMEQVCDVINEVNYNA